MKKFILKTVMALILPICSLFAQEIEVLHELDDYAGRLAVQVALHENLAFIGMKDNSIHILNIEDPSSPEMLGTCESRDTLYNGISGLSFHNNLLLVAGRFLQIFDCSNLNEPVRLSDFYLNGGIGSDPAAINNIVVVPVGPGGGTDFLCLDIIEPHSPQLVSERNGFYASSGAEIDSNYVYISSDIWREGARIFDRNHIDYPVGFVRTEPTFDLKIDGSTAILLCSDGIRIINIENRRNPSIISHLPFSGGYSLDYQAGYAYVATR